MNQLMLLAVAIAFFVYYGGSRVPTILKENKEIVLGIAIGLTICMGMSKIGYFRLIFVPP